MNWKNVSITAIALLSMLLAGCGGQTAPTTTQPVTTTTMESTTTEEPTTTTEETTTTTKKDNKKTTKKKTTTTKKPTTTTTKKTYTTVASWWTAIIGKTTTAEETTTTAEETTTTAEETTTTAEETTTTAEETTTTAEETTTTAEETTTTTEETTTTTKSTRRTTTATRRTSTTARRTTTTTEETTTTTEKPTTTTRKVTTTTEKTTTTTEPPTTTTEKTTTTTAKPKVYGVGETWVVEDQWEFTVNSVKTHWLCNDSWNNSKGYTDEQVVIINYTYKNLGYEGKYQDLYMYSSSFSVYDESGEAAGGTYACTHTKDAKVCIVGTKCTAEEAYVLLNDSSEITLVVEHSTSNGAGRVKATFNLPVEEMPEEDKAEMVEYSRVKGEFTYKYNDFVGHRGDSGTKVAFIPKNTELKTKAETLAMMLSEGKYDSGIIVEKCDAYGKFDTGIDYIPAGDYVVVVVSNNTTQAGKVTADTIRDELGDYLSEENLETLALYIGYSKVAIDDMTLQSKYEHTITHDFGVTYF